MVTLTTRVSGSADEQSEEKLVPKAGVEPALPCDRWYLKPVCLPFHHFGKKGRGGDYPEFTLPASSNYVRSLKKPPGIRSRGLPSLLVRQDRENPH